MAYATPSAKFRSSMQRNKSAVAAICVSEATTVHIRKLTVTAGNGRPGVIANHATTSHANAKGSP